MHSPRIFIDERKIKARVSQLAKEITHSLKGRSAVMIYISNGAMIFAADLARKIPLPLKIDSISAFSYKGKVSSGKLSIFRELKIEIKNEDVILVDDILDTGRTLMAIRELLLKKEPNSVKTCVLLDKPSRRVVPIEADYVGFIIPDKFVVGYGLDYNELYRNLPYIGII